MTQFHKKHRWFGRVDVTGSSHIYPAPILGEEVEDLGQVDIPARRSLGFWSSRFPGESPPLSVGSANETASLRDIVREEIAAALAQQEVQRPLMAEDSEENEASLERVDGDHAPIIDEPTVAFENDTAALVPAGVPPLQLQPDLAPDEEDKCESTIETKCNGPIISD